MSTHSPVVALDGVSVVYDEVPVLGPLDLVVRPDERWIVLGPNGSGKTSLVKILSLYRYPTAGTVEVRTPAWGACDSFWERILAGTAARRPLCSWRRTPTRAGCR